MSGSCKTCAASKHSICTLYALYMHSICTLYVHSCTACGRGCRAPPACTCVHVDAHVPVLRGVHVCACRRIAVSERIEVVTADKELRRMASGVHKNVKLINPVKWCATHALQRHCPRTRRMRCLARSSAAHNARARAHICTSGAPPEPDTSRLDPRDLSRCSAVGCIVRLGAARRTSASVCARSRRWRRYLPRLKGLKSDYSNAPATDDE